MTLDKRIAGAVSVIAAALVLSAPAGASRITVVRDVSARDGRPLPVKPIPVVRDVGARDYILRPARPIRVTRDVGARSHVVARPATRIQVVRDTPARDEAQAARKAAKAIALFRANERATR